MSDFAAFITDSTLRETLGDIEESRTSMRLPVFGSFISELARGANCEFASARFA
jgi:hypothetical protein